MDSGLEIMTTPGPVGRLIAGSGRSGTTWVLDCLADANGMRTVFEPLHPSDSAIASEYAYRAMPYDGVDDRLSEYFRALAAGTVRSMWIDYRRGRDLIFPRPADLLSPAYLGRWLRRWKALWRSYPSLRQRVARQEPLIKCIRANLLIGWLTRACGFRVVLIVRHPCAVIESQLRLGRLWDPEAALERYRSDAALAELTEGRYAELLQADLAPIEALTLRWVIENQFPVEHAAAAGYSVVYYEDLVGAPDVWWPRVCDSLGLASIPSKEAIEAPSQQAAATVRPKGAVGWRRRLEDDQLRAVQGILDATECHLYTVSQVDPVRRAEADATSAC